MSGWHFQATGDETEIFDGADDNATPLVLVPFLESETVEEHQARVRMVAGAPTADRLLREALNALNLIPRKRLHSIEYPDTYRLASAIDTHFKEAANG